MSTALSLGVALEPVMELSDALQAAINAGEWRRATEIDRERRQALEVLLDKLAPSEELNAALAELQQQTHHLMGQAHHHQRRLVREASTLATGRAAAQEYSSTAAAE